MKKNLYYNCCPLAAAEEVWRDNIAMLCRYGDIFNGRRIVVLRVGEGLSNPDEVRALFREHGLTDIDFRERPNDPVLHEGANFIETLEDLKSLDPEEATFYAHTKGVSRAASGIVVRASVRQWRNRMYFECLRDADRIDKVLREYDTAGCFLMDKNIPPSLSWMKWMYCGSFFWFNHAALFSKDWRSLGPSRDRFVTENYLGAHIERERAFSLYGAGYQGAHLYMTGTGVYRCPKCERTFEALLNKPRRARCCSRLQRPVLQHIPELGTPIKTR